MPSSPRRDVFEPDVVGIYHCYNRCSQRAFLCGFDPLTQTDFSHRKEWIRNGLKSLAASMAVDVLDYAVMDNHFHVVLRKMRSKTQTFLAQTGQAGQHCSQEGANA